MRIVGVIAEYDPFHTGHAWQLARLRQLGAERVVVCLSGPVVQRGTAAMLPPAVRTEAALRCGADLVLALPAPWACASAEGFAAGGVAVLSALGCVDTLAFGAEHPDTAALTRLAAALESPAFAAALQKAQAAAPGSPFAAVRAAAAEQLCPGAAALLSHPNDTLAVEYCRALLRQGSLLAPLALPRMGAAHDAETPAAPGFASGSFLRAKIRAAGVAAQAGYLPPAALPLYQKAEAEGALLDPRAFDIAMLSRLRALTPAQLADTRGCTEGLQHRLAAAVRGAGSLEELYAAAKTKRYAHARLRRLALDAALGYTAALPELPPYLHILGAKREALPLCKTAALPCGASLAALARQSPAAAAVAKAEAAAADLAALCRRTPAPMGLCYTQKPVIL